MRYGVNVEKNYFATKQRTLGHSSCHHLSSFISLSVSSDDIIREQPLKMNINIRTFWTLLNHK